MTKPIAFIDGDIILYRAASFCESEFDGEVISDVRQGIHMFKLMLEKWLKEIGPSSDYQVVMTVGKNYRKDLYPLYKAQRKVITPHPVLWELKAEVMEWSETVWEEGIEADDYIGLKVTEDPANRIAVSADKDFRTLPCRLCIPTSHGRKEPIWYDTSEDEANMYWLRQVLTGDVIDNYPGLKGCGPKNAEKVLPTEGPVSSLWPSVVQAYRNKGQTEQDALLMARLARILRHGEYDWDTQEIKLWEPTPSR